MTTEELTILMIKEMLHDWKKSKSIPLANDICDILCDHFKIK